MRTLDYTQNARHETHYSSVTDIMTDKGPSRKECNASRTKKSATGNLNCFTIDVKAVEALVGSPKREVINRIDAIRRRLEGSPVFARQENKRRRRRGLDTGDTINLDRYVRRDWMMWEKMERTPRERRTVTIAVYIAANAGESHESLACRGASSLALAEWLSRNGYNVRILAVWFIKKSYSNGDNHCGTIEVKAPNMPMDAGAIATACCELDFVRTKVFASWTRHANGKIKDGLGQAKAIPKKVADDFGIDFIANHSINNIHSAQQWLERTVAELKKNG